MTTPASGAISFSDVNTALSPIQGSSTNTLNMNNVLFRDFVRNSTNNGQISLSNAYNTYLQNLNFSNATGYTGQGSSFGTANEKLFVSQNNINAPVNVSSDNGQTYSSFSFSGQVPYVSSVAYFNGYYLLVIQTPGVPQHWYVGYSTDGLSWTQVINTTSDVLGNQIVANSTYAIVGTDSSAGYYTTDGTNWNRNATMLPANNHFGGGVPVVFNDVFVGSSINTPSSTVGITYTTDPTTTFTQPISVSQSTVSSFYLQELNNTLYAIGLDANYTSYTQNLYVYSSTNGTSWSGQTTVAMPTVPAPSGSLGFSPGATWYPTFLRYLPLVGKYVIVGTTTDYDASFNFVGNVVVAYADSVTGPWTASLSLTNYSAVGTATPQNFYFVSALSYTNNTLASSYMSADGVNWTTTQNNVAATNVFYTGIISGTTTAGVPNNNYSTFVWS